MKPSENRNGIRATVYAAALAALIVLAWCPAYLAAAETSDAVRESGIMTVGIRADYLPFSEVTGQGDNITYSGFDVDTIRAVAAFIGVQTHFVVVEPGVVVTLVAESVIQVAPGLNHRMGWERVIDYSVTYLAGGTKAMVLASSGIFSLSSLSRKRIAVVAGTDITGIETKIRDGVTIEVETPEAGLLLLTDREVTALVGDFKDLVNLVAESEKPATLRIIKEPIVPIPIALGLPPDDGAWRELMDRALMDLWVSGRYAEIYETWFGSEAKVRLPLDFTMEVWPK
ncbi:MAG: transporter substrate-binding domain-containing protein [Deltaproteobacteria bacterium]|nr:transporter substrate-binding domain-containing protein [Candidatus Zymogenaceae bacterium]